MIIRKRHKRYRSWSAVRISGFYVTWPGKLQPGFTGSSFLVLIFFVVMAMLLAIFSSLIDYRERGLV
jgi:hypothetical protein